MRRNCSLAEISDGKLYNLNDMVKADCHDCMGCSACCHGMGKSIVLDPLDVYRLCEGTGKRFDELLGNRFELNVVDGLILPNLRMDEKTESCSFLNEEGRCSIHAFRPGICRIFPLGRFYEENGFRYFLQVHECKKSDRSKVKVSKWIDTPKLRQNQQFILDWHNYLKELEAGLEGLGQEEQKAVCLQLLGVFYMEPYQVERDFYEQFYERLKRVGK